MKNYLAVSLFGLLISMSASCLAQSENSELDKRCKVVEQTTDEMYENGALIQCYFPNMALLNAYQARIQIISATLGHVRWKDG
ncbi:hypothetical protein [Providencia rustigianii]|uniref:hypothetical protein n=1 Tax=Providencia rustigianii TaxID=158850 RepID=UPI0022402CE2|nr:hypothetical protein [Providencia rustigianii]